MVLSCTWWRRRGYDHEWCFVLLSSWERILKVDQAEGRENGNENSNLSWGIWDVLNNLFMFLKFYIKIPFI